MAKTPAEPTWDRFTASMTKLDVAWAVGLLPANLSSESRFKIPARVLASLIDPAYAQLVARIGYPVIARPTKGPIAFLPPKLAANLTGGIAVPKRDWDEIAAERDAGTHDYGVAMFCATDLADIGGWGFRRAKADLEVVTIAGSMPKTSCGTFAAWFAKQLDEVVAGWAKIPAVKRAERHARILDEDGMLFDT